MEPINYNSHLITRSFPIELLVKSVPNDGSESMERNAKLERIKRGARRALRGSISRAGESISELMLDSRKLGGKEDRVAGVDARTGDEATRCSSGAPELLGCFHAAEFPADRSLFIIAAGSRISISTSGRRGRM